MQSFWEIAQTRFENVVFIANSQFDAGVGLNNVTMSAPVHLTWDTFTDSIRAEELATTSELDLSHSTFLNSYDLRDSTLGVVDAEEAVFDGPASFVHNIHGGVLRMAGVTLQDGLLIDQTSVGGGIDLRQADVGPQTTIRLKDSFLTGPVLLGGSHWESKSEATSKLDIGAAVFQGIEGLDWETLKRIIKRPTGKYAFEEIERRSWNDYLATLRTAEAGFRRDGYEDLAIAAERFRLRKEADIGDLTERAQYWFLNLSCGDGYQLWRLPLWWLAVVSGFTMWLWLIGVSHRGRYHSGRLRRLQHHTRDWVELFSCSLHFFFNLNRPLTDCYPRSKRPVAERIERFERFVGFVAFFVSAAIVSTFLSR
jgi:hypothetical protein